MNEEQIKKEFIEALQYNGEIRMSNYDLELFIQSIDDKEGYSYVSNTNEEFENEKEAIEWAIAKFDGIENIEEWD